MAPKKQKMPDIRTFLLPRTTNRRAGDSPAAAQFGRESLQGDPGSSSTTKESPQPNKATGSQPNKATGSQPNKATGSKPGGATGSKPNKYTGSQPGGATGSPKKMHSPKSVNKENDGDYTMANHLHQFKVKFSPTDRKKYTVSCDRPRTVLEAIKTTGIYDQKIKCSDENIVIQLGEEDRGFIVATHFPCCCVEDGETLIISCESEKVEEARGRPDKPIQSRDKYSVFYIDTVGGIYTKKKRLLRNTALKQFKHLCVYGDKGITIKEAVERDGRFIDDPNNFYLTDNKDPSSITQCIQKVDNKDQKEYKICLPRGCNMKTACGEKPQESPGASDASQQKQDAVMDVVKQSGISVKKTAEKEKANNGNTEEVYKLLREQFPGLREIMEKRFPDDSYQKALDLRKENFGKIQQSFSEVHRVKKLLKLGDSVCKVVIENVRQGSGFVLFDNFVLTNAHLFKDCVEGQRLKEGIQVLVLFNYEDPEPYTNCYYFKLAQPDICYSEGDLDYAIFELNPETLTNNSNAQTKKMKVPPGLLSKFGPMPPNGEACIIGHPAGGVKKMDPTCIIEKEKRAQTVNDHMSSYKDSVFTISSISQLIKDQGIENIMMSGSQADKVATYNTFMYHGSSGSPVFDAHGRVFGLHTGGYLYGFLKPDESVIEFAHPLLKIFEHFVTKLREHGKTELSKRVEKEAKGNPFLKKFLPGSQGVSAEDFENTHNVSAETDELSDSDEPMDTE